MRRFRSAIYALIAIDLVMFVLAFLLASQGGIRQCLLSLCVFIALAVAMDVATVIKAKASTPAVALMVLAVIAAMCVTNANAADLTPTNAPLKEWIDSDKGNTANQLLCSTIGDPGGTGLFGCKGKEVPLHKVLKVFNLAVFAIGALFIAWVLISAIMSSAAEGEFLGKRNHSQWGPLRMTMGGAALVPAFGGFNLAQLIMVWATAVGVGIAGAGVSKVGSSIETVVTEYSAPVRLLSGQDIAQQLDEKTICVINWRRQVARWVNDRLEDTDATSLKWGYTIKDSDGAIQVLYGAPTSDGGYAPDDCGTVTIRVADASSTDDAGVKSIFSAVAGATRQALPVLIDALLTEYAVISSIDVTRSERDASAARIKAAINAYDRFVTSAGAAAATAANTSAAKATIGKGDWVKLGYSTMFGSLRAMSLGKGVSGQIETTSPVRQAHIKDRVTSFFGDLFGSSGASDSGVGFSISPSKIVGAINSMLLTHVDKLGKNVAQHIRAFGSGNPLAALTNLGVEISMWMGAVIMAAIVIFIGISLGSVLTPAIGGVITFIGFILAAVAIPLFFFGVKLAAYLPFLPAVIWTGAILNWLVIVVEALFGAPLWAMVHLDMEGDGLNMQRTGHGYIFMLNLFFRPIMMVGALIFAYAAMSAMFNLFADAVAMMISGLATTTSNWWAGLLMIVGALWVVVVFAEQIITQSLGLVFQIPDKVFTWVGGSFGSDVGADIDRNVGGAAEKGFGAAGGVAREGAKHATYGAGKIAAKKTPEAIENARLGADQRDFDTENRKRTREKWAAEDEEKAERSGSPGSSTGGGNSNGKTQPPKGDY